MIRRTGSILFSFFHPNSLFFWQLFFFLAFLCFLLLLHCLRGLMRGIVDRVSFPSFLYRGLSFFEDGAIGIKVCKFSMGFKHLKN